MKRIKYLLPMAATILLLATPYQSRADTLNTYSASGTFYDGSTLGGTITVDETTGALPSIDLTWSDLSAGAFDTFQGGMPSPACCIDYEFTDSLVTGSLLILALEVPYLYSGFTSATLCTADGGCGNGFYTAATNGTSGYDYLVTNYGTTPAYLTLTSSIVTTPEPNPASLLLIGMSLLGLVAVKRKARLA